MCSNKPTFSASCSWWWLWNIAYNYGYKLVCADGKFSQPYKTYLGKDAVDNFINNMIWESKYGSNMMKKHFNRELVVAKEDDEDFRSSTKCWIYDNDYVDNDPEVRDYFHITKKYTDTDCYINLKIDYKIPVLFYNLKNYESHLIQKLDKFCLKIKVIPNGLGKYMSFTISNKLSFIDSFQFLRSSLDS